MKRRTGDWGLYVVLALAAGWVAGVTVAWHLTPWLYALSATMLAVAVIQLILKEEA